VAHGRAVPPPLLAAESSNDTFLVWANRAETRGKTSGDEGHAFDVVARISVAHGHAVPPPLLAAESSNDTFLVSGNQLI
jgi:hypothetical protein